MKKLILVVISFGFVFMAKAQDTPKYSYDDLKSTASQSKVQAFVSQFLNNYHYRKFTLDDSLSARVWKNFLENVDGSKAYFTKAEIAEFSKYKFTIDEALVSGDLTAAFEVCNAYRKKYKTRHSYIKNYLAKPLDYNTSMTYQIDRSKGPWASDEKELDLVWDRIILSQALNAKLSGSADSNIVKNLNKRYDMFETRVMKWRSEDIFQIFMNAFTEEIDPHTSYMVPSNAAQFNIEMSQSLEGIGATLQNEGDFVMIKDIVAGGPLFKSGQASKNDNILAVAQGDEGEFQDIVGWLTDDAVKLIRGKKGTVVRLKLIASDAPAGSDPKILRIVREKIKLEEAVATSKVIDIKQDKKDYKLGLIDIPMFYRDFEYARQGGDFQSTTRDVKKFLEDFKNQGVDGVLIDLRNNGGGSLTEAISLTGLFIQDGPVVQRKTSRGKVDVESDTDKELVYGGPLMILQNRFSASASEIFAGAIQDYKRGLIVGETSYGKGTVQQLVDLDQFLNSPRQASRKDRTPAVASNGGAGSNSGFDGQERFGQLKLTTEKFYRITGNSTQLKGVSADIEMPTPFDADEMGESALPTALPYDQVEASNYVKTGDISDKVISKLNNKFQSRLKSDLALKELVQDLKEYKSEKDKNEYSLNLAERMILKKETEDNRKSLKKLSKQNLVEKKPEVKKENAGAKIDEAVIAKKEPEIDLYMVESQKLLCDMVQILK
jgi:carboxyl-terminal processing protease